MILECLLKPSKAKRFLNGRLIENHINYQKLKNRTLCSQMKRAD